MVQQAPHQEGPDDANSNASHSPIKEGVSTEQPVLCLAGGSRLLIVVIWTTSTWRQLISNKTQQTIDVTAESEMQYVDLNDYDRPVHIRNFTQ